jgi:hypothetical protein
LKRWTLKDILKRSALVTDGDARESAAGEGAAEQAS